MTTSWSVITFPTWWLLFPLAWAVAYRAGIVVTVRWRVTDGDTVKVAGPQFGVPVRVDGIEAPDKDTLHGRLSTGRMRRLWLPLPLWPVVVVRTGSSHGRWVGRVYAPWSVGAMQRLTGGAARWDYQRDRRSPLRGWRRWTHGEAG